jgi:hypothetical protein
MYVYTYVSECRIGTLMTRIRRIKTDLICFYFQNPRHPRSELNNVEYEAKGTVYRG